MDKKIYSTFSLTATIFFIILNAFFLAGKTFLEQHGFDQSVLIIGNLVLFAATLLSFFSAKRGLIAENPNAFVRSVYGSIMVKLFTNVFNYGSNKLNLSSP